MQISGHHHSLGIRELRNAPRSGLILTAYCPNLIAKRVILAYKPSHKWLLGGHGSSRAEKARIFRGFIP